ncbi:MAG: peptidoglycan recognition family protein [Oscillospiraceae bacterium]
MRNKPKKKKRFLINILRMMVLVLIAALLYGFFAKGWFTGRKVDQIAKQPVPNWVDVQLIDIDGASRRGEKLDGIKDIVIHYVGNPGTTAKQNRGFFANPKSGISAHFLVGLKGEVLQCVPLDEKSSASNWRNNDTISIEVCHPDDTGKFTDVTYQSLVRLTAWLCETASLKTNHIIRHYDITGKECPRYFVKHEDAWQQFKEDVSHSLINE